MKNIKLIYAFFLLIAVAIGCSLPDGIDDDTAFAGSATAPSKVEALYNVTQDNSGNVTITPNGEGASSFEIYFGDNPTAEPTKVMLGKSVTHEYKEGIYNVKIVAIGVTGLKTEVTQKLEVSLKSPQNLKVTITNDLQTSRKVNVKADADFATMFDVYFGEAGNTDPVSGNIGSTVSYTYKKAGNYTIKVVSKSNAIKTTDYSENFKVTEVLQPTTFAPTPPARQDANVISIYGSKYTNLAGTNFFPDWGQAGQGSSWAEFDLGGDKMLNYINLSYQGIAFADNTTIDVTNMEFIHLDVWTADAQKIETSLISKTQSNGERPVVKDLVANKWTSLDIPISAFTSQNGFKVNDIFQLKFVGTPWAKGTVFIDNIYFHKAPTPVSGVAGKWKLVPEAGSLKVGPSLGNGDWWSIDGAAIITRACYFDDVYVFGANGSFLNELGADTWIEDWQGSVGCGAPIAPHNGGSGATYVYDAVAKTIKINGAGSYLGIPKAVNAGELKKGDLPPSSITYNVTLTENNTIMTVAIEAGSGIHWTYKLIRI